MKKSLTEKKVLKKLGIPDFRHMTKDKIVKFATMLDRMDPEVAKKALEQFPEFATAVKDIVAYYRESVEKLIDANNVSVQDFYRTCDNIIATLEKQLEDRELTFEEKNIIIDKMIILAEMKSAKDTENKHYHLSILRDLMLGGLGLCVIGAGILGLRTDTFDFLKDDNSDDERDDDYAA